MYQCGFSRTVWAHDGVNLPLVDGQIQSPHDLGSIGCNAEAVDGKKLSQKKKRNENLNIVPTCDILASRGRLPTPSSLSFLMPTVTFVLPDGSIVTADAPKGETILHIALENGVPMEHACGGNGFCTTCMCKVKSGMEHLSPRNDREENMGITEDPDRLSCQSEVEGDVTVEVQEY